MLLLMRGFVFRCATSTRDAIGCFRTHRRVGALCKNRSPPQPIAFWGFDEEELHPQQR
jgi:hypothetical protein